MAPPINVRKRSARTPRKPHKKIRRAGGCRLQAGVRELERAVSVGDSVEGKQLQRQLGERIQEARHNDSGFCFILSLSCNNMFIHVSAAVRQQFMVLTLNSAGLERDSLPAAQGRTPDRTPTYHPFESCQGPVNLPRLTCQRHILTLPPADDSISLSSFGGEGWEEEAVTQGSRSCPCLPSCLCPSPRPSPRASLAGRGRRPGGSVKMRPLARPLNLLR
jgi:hypothetical protein